MGGIRGGMGESRGQRIVTASQPYGNRPGPSRSMNMGSGSDNRRVYVGNLAYETTWGDLKDHMKMAGLVVRADVLLDPTGKSKGCGLVEFATISGAHDAIHRLHNSQLNGRPIFVREDRETGASTAPVRNDRVDRGDRETRDNNRGAESERSHAPVVAKLGLSRSVYVGNLSWEVAWQDLKDHMKTVGDVVHADVLIDAPTGRSKGCGIVEFANVEGANSAMLTLQNTILKGRPIFIREDRERIDQGDGNNRLYVGNLDFKVRWFDLKDHFKTIGNVTRADVAMEDDGFRSKGYGIVEYAAAEDAARAVAELNDSELNGRPINVREDREEKRRFN